MALINPIQVLWYLFFTAVGILGIGFLIGFHEFGHFIFCKLFNIRTPTFSIGMGPKIFKKRIGDTEFALSAIPLGGYVEIAGADSKSTDPNSFTKKSYLQKMIVIAGGIIFNILFAYIALSMLFFIGMPKSNLVYPRYASTVINMVEENSPADQAQLKKGDKILSIDNITLKNNALLLIEYVKAHPNHKSNLVITRKSDNDIHTIETNIGQKTVANQEIGYLGIDFEIPRYNFFQSIFYGIHATHAIIAQVILTFKSIFTQRSIELVGGPLMIISQTVKGAEKGFTIFLLLLSLISINLAVLNVLPLPIMDGGQALFYTIEAIIRRPLPDQVKVYIHYACWFSILLLMVLLSIKDVIRIFG